jgi:putative ABC transport system permease protein
VIGGGLVWLAAKATPPDLPLTVETSRLVSTYAVLVVCAVIGSLFSIRRVMRIDPAQAIGAAA